MKANYANVNGNIMPSGKAAISIFDRGLLYGDGLYETIRVKENCCIRFDAHMARLHSGAQMLGMHNAIEGFNFHSAIADLLNANGFVDARVRITVTRTPTVFITTDSLPEFTMQTSRAITSSYRRDEKSLLCSIKTLNCLPSVMASLEAQSAGFDDAILLNTQGNVAEGTTANLFVLKDRRLLTPSLDQGCLPGTVRSVVMEIAGSLGLAVEETTISPDFLFDADELFFSSAIRLLRPIIRLNSRRIGDGSHRICEEILNVILAQQL